MKIRILWALLALPLICPDLQAQDEPIRFAKGKFLVGIGINIGFFNPEDVNQYIEDWMSSKGFLELLGTSDMIMNLGAHFDMGYRINDNIELYGTLEYCAGMKYISVSGGSNYFFHLSRFSPGFIANILIPLSSSARNSFFIGGGVLYHIMKFEEYSGNTAGYRIQAGFSLNNFNFNPQIFLAYDGAKTSDQDYENFELKFSGIQIGVNLNF
ncbi:MAG: outer membrane beta-barrel protein [Bacteroidales bacterium]|nr:MAG: outer membrane beta-barrel protein [Bacteroidales bacterium]